MHPHTRTQSQHRCLMEHKTPAGRRLGLPAPSIQQDHIPDRQKQKLHGAVSTSDGAIPKLATSDSVYSGTPTPSCRIFITWLLCTLLKCEDQMSLLKLSVTLQYHYRRPRKVHELHVRCAIKGFCWVADVKEGHMDALQRKTA